MRPTDLTIVSINNEKQRINDNNEKNCKVKEDGVKGHEEEDNDGDDNDDNEEEDNDDDDNGDGDNDEDEEEDNDDDDNEDGGNEEDEDEEQLIDMEKEAADVETLKRKGLREMRSLSGSGYVVHSRLRKNTRTLGYFVNDLKDKYADKLALLSQTTGADEGGGGDSSLYDPNSSSSSSSDSGGGFLNDVHLNPISKYNEKVELVGLTLYEINRERRSSKNNFAIVDQLPPSQSSNQINKLAINVKKVTPELTCPICLGVLRSVV